MADRINEQQVNAILADWGAANSNLQRTVSQAAAFGVRSVQLFNTFAATETDAQSVTDTTARRDADMTAWYQANKSDLVAILDAVANAGGVTRAQLLTNLGTLPATQF